MKTSESKYCQCMYFTANALARKVEKMAKLSWDKVGLSPSHGYLLMMVVEDPGVQPTVLSRHLQLEPSTITRLTEKLEQKKYVIRTIAGKATNVYPTPKGKDLYPKLKDCQQNFYTHCGEVFGKEESSRMVNHMSKMADKLCN